MKSLRDEKPWVLSRQDDNGNVFEINHFKDKDEAERQKKILQARGHKQIYFVEKKEVKL